MENPEKYLTLAFDPGDITGVVLVDNNATLIAKANMAAGSMATFILDTVRAYASSSDYVMVRAIYEDWRIYGHKAQSLKGSEVKAARVIGLIEMWAGANNIPVYSQMAGILPIAMKWSRIRPIGQHRVNHWVDAYNHAFHWLHINGFVQTAFQRELAEGHNVTGRVFTSEDYVRVVSQE